MITKYKKSNHWLCCCKYVPQNKNIELYEEMAQLLGIYAYTKDKINIKPYVIIGKDL